MVRLSGKCDGRRWGDLIRILNFCRSLDKADAVIVNGDLAINGPDSDAEIAFAATTLGRSAACSVWNRARRRSRRSPLPCRTMQRQGYR